MLSRNSTQLSQHNHSVSLLQTHLAVNKDTAVEMLRKIELFYRIKKTKNSFYKNVHATLENLIPKIMRYFLDELQAGERVYHYADGDFIKVSIERLLYKKTSRDAKHIFVDAAFDYPEIILYQEILLPIIGTQLEYLFSGLQELRDRLGFYDTYAMYNMLKATDEKNLPGLALYASTLKAEIVKSVIFNQTYSYNRTEKFLSIEYALQQKIEDCQGARIDIQAAHHALTRIKMDKLTQNILLNDLKLKTIGRIPNICKILIETAIAFRQHEAFSISKNTLRNTIRYGTLSNEMSKNADLISLQDQMNGDFLDRDNQPFINDEFLDIILHKLSVPACATPQPCLKERLQPHNLARLHAEYDFFALNKTLPDNRQPSRMNFRPSSAYSFEMVSSLMILGLVGIICIFMLYSARQRKANSPFWNKARKNPGAETAPLMESNTNRRLHSK